MNIKNIKYLILTIIIVFIGILPVKADILDFSKLGSAKITLKESIEKTPIEGAEITLYQIAEAKEVNYNLTFELLENLNECNIDLSDLKDSNLIKNLEECIKDKELPIRTILTDENGIANFEELKLGLYLVKETNKVKGYSNIDSFIIMIPENIDNTWIYDIEATPKTDIIRVMDLTVKKVWNNVSYNTPNSVTIELYKGEDLIDTVILNEENKWIYTWTDIEKSDEYSVLETNVPENYIDTYRQEDNTFIVTNTKKLVQTGSLSWISQLLSLLGIVFIIIGIIYKKRNNYE